MRTNNRKIKKQTSYGPIMRVDASTCKRDKGIVPLTIKVGINTCDTVLVD
jgi:hypothetical protein